MQPRAASLAARIKEQLPTAEITVTPGSKKSELAVLVDGAQVFSRLEEHRFPEADEIVGICKTLPKK